MYVKFYDGGGDEEGDTRFFESMTNMQQIQGGKEISSTMDRFWCDVFFALRIDDISSVLSELGLIDEKSEDEASTHPEVVFDELKILKHVRMCNVACLDAIHHSLSGLGITRRTMVSIDRWLSCSVDRTPPSSSSVINSFRLSYEACMRAVFECTRLIHVVVASHGAADATQQQTLARSKRAYDDATEMFMKDGDGLKRWLQTCWVERHLSFRRGTSHARDVLLSRTLGLSLPQAYVAIRRLAHERLECSVLPHGREASRGRTSYENLHRVMISILNAYSQNVLSGAVIQNTTESGGRDGVDKDATNVCHHHYSPLVTVYEACVHAYVNDGYMMRRAMHPEGTLVVDRRMSRNVDMIDIVANVVLPRILDPKHTISTPFSIIRNADEVPLPLNMFRRTVIITHSGIEVHESRDGVVKMVHRDLSRLIPKCFLSRSDNHSSSTLLSSSSSPWMLDLIQDVLTHRLRRGGGEEDDGTDLTRLFHDFVLRYTEAAGLIRFSYDVQTDSSLTLVAVDNRKNPFTVASILFTLFNLRPATWNVVVVCGSDNVDYMRRSLCTPHCIGATLIVMSELDTKRFDFESYNCLLKDPSFWKDIPGEVALFVQDDGMLVRPGLEDMLQFGKDDACMSLPYDYVGAPWKEGQDGLERLSNPQLVGNGGVSLRNIQEMRRVAQEGADTGDDRVLFFNNDQPIPEDVYFAHRVRRVAPRNVASKFSMEQVYSEDALGFHKPWCYLPRGDVARYLDASVRLVADRSI